MSAVHTPLPTGLAAHVEIEEAHGARFDAEAVRPWRVVGWGTRLVRLGLLPDEAEAWCERYARDCEAAERVTAGVGEGVGSSPGPRSPSERVIEAAERVRAVHARLTQPQIEALEGALVHNFRLVDLAVMLGLRPRDTETMAAFAGRVCRRVQDRLARVVILAIGPAGNNCVIS